MKCPNCGHENRADAKFCDECGTALAPAEEADPRQALLDRLLPQALRDKIQASGTIEPERRPVTVLFADLSGFTALGEKLDPEELTALTNECLEAMVKSVFKYEGFVDKLIGDAVMALFGAPVAHEDDPERALRCVLEMGEAIQALGWTLPEDSPPLSLHAGLHTGDVVAGAVGSDLHLEYTATGDTVNLASRLQDLASSEEILISEDTYRLTKPLFDFEEKPSQRVKGKKEKVSPFLLLREKPVPEAVRGIEGLSSPLIGRDEELQQLQEAIEGLLAGQGHIAVVMGEPGIGKSRLVAEARNHARENLAGRLSWHEGRSVSYERRATYLPMVEILGSYLGISPGDDDRQALGRLLRHTRRLFPGRASEIASYLGTFLDLRLDRDMRERVRHLDGKAMQAQIFAALREFLEAAAAENPLVLVFEDLHWADSSTIELIERLLDSTDRASIGLFLISRPEREQPWWHAKVEAETRFPHRFAEIELAPLSSEESDSLVNNLLTVAELPGGVKSIILQKSEGNPFFVEEVIRGMIEAKVLVKQGDRWRATARVLDVEIPDNLQSVILARLDRLEGETRRLLQVASVIGREFQHPILQQVYAGNGMLDQRLSDLLRMELVREKARLPERQYSFKHHLTQEVAYSTLLKERRADYHQRSAQAIESLYPDRLEEFYGTLAHHWYQAGVSDQAIHYSIKAGEQAASLYANEEALGHYDRALELLEEKGDQEQLALTLEKKGDVYYFQRLIETAFGAYDRAIEKWNALGDPDKPALIRLYRKIGVGVGRWSGKHDRANEYLFAALALLEEQPDDLERVRVLSGLAFRATISHYDEPGWSPDFDKGLAYGTEAVSLAEGLESLPDVSEAYDALSIVQFSIGNLEQFRRIPRKRLSILEKTQDPFELLDAHLMVAWSSGDGGDFATALEHVHSGLALGEKVGSIQGQWQGLRILSWIHFWSGRWDEAMDFAHQGLKVSERSDEASLRIPFLSFLRAIAMLRGRSAEATDHRNEVDQLLPLGRGPRDVFTNDAFLYATLEDWERAIESLRTAIEHKGIIPHDRLILAALAEALAEAGQVEEAEEVAASVQVGELPLMWLPAGAILQRAYGAIHAQREEWDEAEVAYQRALEFLETTEMPLERAQTLRALGRMYLKRGEEDDAGRARSVIEEAGEIYESLEARPLIEQVDELLGQLEASEP